MNSNDKRRARLGAIHAVLDALPYTHKDMAVACAPDPHVVRQASTLALVDDHHL